MLLYPDFMAVALIFYLLNNSKIIENLKSCSNPCFPNSIVAHFGKIFSQVKVSHGELGRDIESRSAGCQHMSAQKPFPGDSGKGILSKEMICRDSGRLTRWLCQGQRVEAEVASGKFASYIFSL